MKNFDWSKFNLKISVRAEAQSAYNAWTIPSALERWLVRKAQYSIAYAILKNKNDFVEESDCYEWLWEEDGSVKVMRGKILEANGKNFLRFDFDCDGVVTVIISKEEGITNIELLQEKISGDDVSVIERHINFSKEWTFYLANLKSFLEGGIDLRNKSVNAMQKVRA